VPDSPTAKNDVAPPCAHPPLSCDIVMKGGVTSGVVYPSAILSLASRYRFRSIGGTSAGAIAAAVLAAAEHRRHDGSLAGFEVIGRLPGELGSTPGGRPFMLQLLQADKATRPLFNAAVGFMRHGGVVGFLCLLTAFWPAVALALVVAVASILLSAVGHADAAFAVGGGAASVAILVTGLVAGALRGLRAIAGNDFGLCRLPGVGTAAEPALTAWLHRQIQEAAGLTVAVAPLTFSDLWGAGAPSGPASKDAARLKRLQDLSHDSDWRRVDLQMMTTDLTQGQPVRLPVVYDRHASTLEDRAGYLLFDHCELRRFFPDSVVAQLVCCAEPFDDDAVIAAVRAFKLDVLGVRDNETGRVLRLPIGPDLPILVAARMSLSFPILISAIPLWRLVFSNGSPSVQRAIFSDGGITSNFPIHFFDAPLPTRPTFGLDLTSFAPARRRTSPTHACVTKPGKPSAQAPDHVREILGLKDFAVALKDAAQNWRDNAQARLPGYRDRIAHIKLDAKEGGLNLAMDPTVLDHLGARGALAGNDLRELFSGPGDALSPADHWNDHRFTRYRMTMAMMERLLRAYRRGWCSENIDSVTTPYAERVEQGQATAPYKFSASQREAAEATTTAYLELVASWPEDQLDDAGVPHPPAILRSVPPV
jgi:predicted acylesterase/phospholipase RssA